MVQLSWYDSLGLSEQTQEGIRGEFTKTLLLSNRSPDFLVNWAKIDENLEAYRPAVDSLSAIARSTDKRGAIAELVRSKPSVLPVLPLLVAWRKKKANVLLERGDGTETSFELDFSGKRVPNAEEAHQVADFCEATGITRVISNIGDLSAYIRGVEVGMDTNARKNRSGSFMEVRVVPLVRSALADVGAWKELEKQPFSRVCPKALEDRSDVGSRTFDFLATNGKRHVAFEINFYDQVGSKPLEIVSSYLHQADQLGRYGWEFVWVTDGPAWKKEPLRMRDAFERLPAILNLSFCRRGVLHQILQISPAA